MYRDAFRRGRDAGSTRQRMSSSARIFLWIWWSGIRARLCVRGGANGIRYGLRLVRVSGGEDFMDDSREACCPPFHLYF